jgi:amino acid adenylation domain-containing protein
MNRDIESIDPLTPMQEGILFHTLLEPGAYLQQLRCRLEGPLDAGALDAAWQSVFDRHSALRSVFLWERLERPLQVVMARCEVQLEQLDWRTAAPMTLEAWLEDDRARGIALDRAPLSRFTLIRTTDDVHELVWTHSHLLLDGWSTSIVFAEVRDALRGIARPAPPPYCDYLAWLRRQDLRAAERFWRRELGDFTAATPLVLARRDTHAEHSAWQELRVRVDAHPLIQAARQERVTLNTLLSGMWGLLLARTAEESDVAFGVTVAGRPAELPGVGSMVGLLINTIPLRLPVPLATPAREWLRGVQERQSAAGEQSFVPLTKIREWSGVAAGTQLFETLFVFENYPLEVAPEDTFGGVRITEVSLPERTNYPLTVIAEPEGDAMQLRFVYDTRRFDGPSVARMARIYTTLLESLPSRLDAPLHALPLLSDGERRRALDEWNDTAASYNRNVCMHELFERQAARTPGAIAVTNGTMSMTYAELDAAANRVAHVLAENGVGHGSFVGICADRGLEMIPALLGILKLGAAYVPVETSWPLARMETIFSSLHVTCVCVTGCRTFDGRRTIALEPVLSSEARGEPAAKPAAPVTAAVTAGDVAYVIFTSGSSGTPKGVVVRHRPVINLIEWVSSTFGINASDRVLFTTSLCFDLSVYDIFGLLAAGGSIRVASDAEVHDPEALVRILTTEPVTYWDSAPAALLQCVPFFPAGTHEQLRLVFLSGDWVPLRLREQVVATFPRADFIALGGATEATVWSNWFRVGELDPRWVSIPYGRPIRNARYYVLDARLEPLPPGVPGDLYIAGEVLADGYANSPGLTAQKFIADPFHGGRMYRTGDRARFFEDGNLEFLGRLDQQVKVRGFRIELGEIEAALATHDSVGEAVVVVRDDGAGRQLVAYVIPAADGMRDAAPLRAHLALRLPPYMIPPAFVFVDALPVTANGKLDRKALPAPEAASGEKAAHTDPVAALVAQAWCEVLGAAALPSGVNFFEAGGHSLLAVRLVARLREAFALDVPLRLVFDEPTIERQAAVIRNDLRTRAGAPPAAIARAPRDAAARPSFAQQRLWFLQQLEPASAFYNVPIAAKLHGQLDVAVLRAALEEIVRRHEVLRGRFPSAGLHVIDDDAAVPFEEVDLRDTPEAWARVIEDAARKPFDLARDRVIRTTLVRTADDGYVLLVVMHHIVSDGRTIGIFIGELLELYRAFAEGRPSPLPALPIQYADYAAWERDVLAPGLQLLTEWWVRQLSGAAATEVPTDRPRPQILSFRGHTLPFTFSEELSASLRALARREGATLFMTLAAAFELLLAWESGRDDVVIGTDVANRTQTETQGLIGFFVNQLVLRTVIDPAESFSSLVRRVRATTVDAYAHQDVPFESVVQAVNPPRDASRMPLFQIKFVLQEAPPLDLEMLGLRIEPLPVATGTAKYDLLLTVEDLPSLTGTLEYATDLYDSSTAARLAGRWRTLLEQCVLAPERNCADLRAAVDAAGISVVAERERARREDGLRKLRAIRRTPRTDTREPS